MKHFTIEQSPYSSKYRINPSDEVYSYFAGINFAGRIGARILGLSFANYCRFARDKYNATIYGKLGYPYIQFEEKADAQKFADLLNLYWIKGNKNL